MAVLSNDQIKNPSQNRFKKKNTWVQSVRAAAEGRLRGLEMISWRLKLRPCSRLLVGGAGHKHKDSELMDLYANARTNIDIAHVNSKL